MYKKSTKTKRHKKISNHKKTLRYKGGVHTTHTRVPKPLTELQYNYLHLLRTIDNSVKQIKEQLLKLEKDII